MLDDRRHFVPGGTYFFTELLNSCRNCQALDKASGIFAGKTTEGSDRFAQSMGYPSGCLGVGLGVYLSDEDS